LLLFNESKTTHLMYSKCTLAPERTNVTFAKKEEKPNPRIRY